MKQKIGMAILATAISAAFMVACSGVDSVSSQVENIESELLKKMSSSSEEDLEKSSSSREVSSDVKKNSGEKSSASKAKSSSSAKASAKSSSSAKASGKSSSSSKVKSSSSVVESSSSKALDGSFVFDDPGKCKPSKNPINKGETVDWSFTCGSGITVSEILKASLVWTFEGGLPATVSENGLSGVSIKGVSYANSGKFTPTMAVTKANGLGAKIACEPLQVNGTPITGCECSALNATKNLNGEMVVDVASETSVKYSVTGCATAGANITSYTWANATGAGGAATATVLAKGEVAHAKVTVANDDNTEIQVDCGEVIAVDSRVPDYEITDTGSSNKIFFKGEKGQVSATIVMNLPNGWNTISASCTFVCQVERGSDGDGRISGTVGTAKLSGGDYVTANIPVSSTVDGYPLELLLDIGSNESVSCFISF